MADFGIKVSKEGEDVNVSSIKNTLVDTSYPLLKVKSSGSGTLSVSDGTPDSDTITHSLGYIPNVMVFGQTYSVNGGAKNSRYIKYPYKELLSTYTSEFSYTITATQLVISGGFNDDSSNSDTFDYFYYIFYDQ